MRSYRAVDLVALPATSASGCIALCTQLVTVAGAKRPLPDYVDRALEGVCRAKDTLHQAVSRRKASAKDVQRAADIKVDAAWRSVYLLTRSYMQLPEGSAEAQQARRIHAALFPDGLRFTQLPWHSEWAHSDTRIARIREGLDEDIRGLRGTAQLEQLYLAHEEYGKALGITATVAAPPENPSVRDPYLAAMAAVRRYVVCVVASIDEADDATIARADALLQPLIDWPTRTAAKPQPPATAKVNGARSPT